MTSLELCNYFFAHIENLIRTGNYPTDLSKKDRIAVLFSKSEIRIDPKSFTIELPGLGVLKPVQDLKLDGNLEFDWVGIVESHFKGNVDVIMGSGNPFVIHSDQELPVKKGLILAIPAALHSYTDHENSLLTGYEC